MIMYKYMSSLGNNGHNVFGKIHVRNIDISGVLSWHCLYSQFVLEFHTGLHIFIWGRCSRDRMVVGFTTTYAISAYHH